MNRRAENNEKPQAILLSTAYLPNIRYFSKLLSDAEVYIEVWDTYQKQSYRNRTSICGANGKLDLVIPVKRPRGNRTLTRDIILDYDMPWNSIHWKAITSAYRHSPFFNIFEAELSPFFEKRMKFLLDWNFMLLEWTGKVTGANIPYKTTDEYIRLPHSFDDQRESIHPKPQKQTEDRYFKPIPYFQVFAARNGHIKNLSFIDLLFNEGPQAVDLCKSCIV